MRQQTAASPTGMPGATCATASPDSRQSCINSWILQHLVAPGTVGGCAGLSPDFLQSCLNDLVAKKQQELGEQQQQAPVDPVPNNHGFVGGSCSTVNPTNLQDCINSFIQTLQVAADVDHNKIACALEDQSCLNAYVLGLQQQTGLLGGCAGVAPEFKQACINNYVLSLQQKQNMGVGAGAVLPVGAGAVMPVSAGAVMPVGAGAVLP